MPKTFIIHIDHNYPFVLPHKNKLPPQSVIKVRRTIAIADISKQLSNKILFANNLRNKNLIKIQSIVQSSSSLQINYEHIQSPQINRNNQFWQAIMPQLHSFAQYLINIGIKTEISANRIGVTMEGVLKYYLGVQFELSEDENQQELKYHYQNVLHQMINAYGIQYNQDQSINEEELNQSAQIVRYNNDRSIQKYRKASVATTPAYQYSTYKLNDELNRIKTSVREMARYHYGTQNRDLSNNKNQYQYHVQYERSQEKTKALSPSYFQNYARKQSNRKYSGDNNAVMESNRKLSAKFSDFRSDRNNSKQYSHRSVVKVEGGRIRSRVQQSKYQQYIQIASANKNNKYLKDFMSVLQDGQNKQQIFQYENQKLPISYTPETTPNTTKLHNSRYLSNQTQALKTRVQQSIKNSLKIIKKVKGIC